MDCFVAALLAMTLGKRKRSLPPFLTAGFFFGAQEGLRPLRHIYRMSTDGRGAKTP
jgi:hypothetical protein